MDIPLRAANGHVWRLGPFLTVLSSIRAKFKVPKSAAEMRE